MTTCQPSLCRIMGQHPASSWTPGHIASVAVAVFLYAVTAGIVLVLLGLVIRSVWDALRPRHGRVLPAGSREEDRAGITRETGERKTAA